MCCVGTKLVVRDYYYLVSCFVACDATDEKSAKQYGELGVDWSEHMFARDNFQSLLRVGAIKCTDKGNYYLSDSQCLKKLELKCG